MMRRAAIRVFAFVVLFLAGTCAQAGQIVVGSLNMEWFGHGNRPRTEAQIKTVAAYIKSLEVDVLAVQEISRTGDKSGNGEPDWDDLLAELGDGYQGWVGKTGSSQRIGFIWRAGRVALSDLGELKGIKRDAVPSCPSKTFPRIPVTAFVKSKGGGVDFRLVTVHLFWTYNKARYAEAKKLNAWVKEYLQGDSDKDLVIIGDCNTKEMGAGDSGSSKTITNLEEDGVLTCVSKDHPEYTTPASKERYDHALLTKALLDGEYIKGSWDVRREAAAAAPSAYMKTISNHVPVSVAISDDEDGDDDPAGDHGVSE